MMTRLQSAPRARLAGRQYLGGAGLSVQGPWELRHAGPGVSPSGDVENSLMEYRIEMINFEGQDNRLDFLVRRVNELGKDGWRVVSVDLTPHPAFKTGPLPVLLERPAVSHSETRSAA